MLSFLWATFTAGAQGTFQNLDFESGTFIPVPGDPYGSVEFAPGLPGWVGYCGTNQQTLLLYNNAFLGSPGIGIEGTQHGAIDGQYSVLLQSGGYMGSFVNTSISQTGLVPVGTQSILLKAENFSGSPPTDFSVNLNGQTLSLIPLETETNYVLYGAEVSQFAGTTAELTLTALSVGPYNQFNNVLFDDIQFSPSSVPEPSVFGLIALGGLFFGLRRGENPS